MKFNGFIDLYDNWNGIVCINDNDLNRIFTGSVIDLVEGDKYNSISHKEVVAFGVYDDKLCVRIV